MAEIQPLTAPVTMSAADYYQLRTRIAEADAALVRAAALVKAKEALIRELALKYGFDPAFTRWQCNDETLAFAFA